MKLTDILAKIAKGETLTDEEKTFAGSFDLQAELNSAASASRKKAEKERDDFKALAEQITQEFEEYKTQNDPAKNQGENAKLLARIEKLEAAKKAAEDKVAQTERTAKVRALAKEAGIVAAKGVDASTLDLLVDNLMGSIDLDDADAVKAAFDGFKGKNAGLIAAETTGGAGQKGAPGAPAYSGPNPFAKETFNLTKQCELIRDNPTQAKSLAAAAGVTIEE